MSDYLEVDPETYWQDDVRAGRDEWDQFVRHVEEDERDHRDRDVGEKA